VILINKKRQSSRRLSNHTQLAQVFEVLGSNTNPILTQLAKTRRALFVEGKDFQILGKFARKLGLNQIGNRQDFAVVIVEGFNPERIRSLKTGIETTLGAKIVSAAILDRDYRSDEESAAIAKGCRAFCNYVTIHKCKEIENFLLVADAIDRAASRKIIDHGKRTGKNKSYTPVAGKVLSSFSNSKKSYITSQFLSESRRFHRENSPKIDETKVSEKTLNMIDELWPDENARLRLISGKEALVIINQNLQKNYDISVTPTSIIDAMRADEIPSEMKVLLDFLKCFAATSTKI
ncbi:MAG: hypothetical protein HQ483_14825, partial [Rhodospirillales bacterium]|nr:hypothetical protein [Rhodospirillales bacterium]